MIIGVVAVDKNWGIGRTNKDTGKGELLFKLKKDMEFFKNTTMDSIVFLGWNTLLSFPGSKPLKHRSTICLCPEGIERDDCFCIHDFNTAVQLVKELAKTKNVYVIGGAMLYKSMLPYYDEVLVTKVDADGEAEVFFPNLDDDASYEVTQVLPAVEDEGYLTQLYSYTRKIPLENLEG
jgi:dihydrofolate reductase